MSPWTGAEEDPDRFLIYFIEQGHENHHPLYNVQGLVRLGSRWAANKLICIIGTGNKVKLIKLNDIEVA